MNNSRHCLIVYSLAYAHRHKRSKIIKVINERYTNVLTDPIENPLKPRWLQEATSLSDIVFLIGAVFTSTVMIKSFAGSL